MDMEYYRVVIVQPHTHQHPQTLVHIHKYATVFALASEIWRLLPLHSDWFRLLPTDTKLDIRPDSEFGRDLDENQILNNAIPHPLFTTLFALTRLPTTVQPDFQTTQVAYDASNTFGGAREAQFQAAQPAFHDRNDYYEAYQAQFPATQFPLDNSNVLPEAYQPANSDLHISEQVGYTSTQSAPTGNISTQAKQKRRRGPAYRVRPIDPSDFTEEMTKDAKRFPEQCANLDEEDQKQWENLRGMLLGPDLRQGTAYRTEQSTGKIRGEIRNTMCKLEEVSRGRRAKFTVSGTREKRRRKAKKEVTSAKASLSPQLTLPTGPPAAPAFGALPPNHFPPIDPQMRAHDGNLARGGPAAGANTSDESAREEYLAAILRENMPRE